MLIERRREETRDFGGFAGLNIAAVNHVDGFAVLKKSDRWRRRWERSENFAQMCDCGVITAREDRSGAIRALRMLKRHADAGTGTTSRASANRIYDHQGCSGGGENAVDIRRSAGLFDTKARQVLAHRYKQLFGIGHNRIIAREAQFRIGREFRTPSFSSRKLRRARGPT